MARRAGAANPSDDEYEDESDDEEDILDEEDVIVETEIDTADMYVMVRDTFKGVCYNHNASRSSLTLYKGISLHRSVFIMPALFLSSPYI